MQEKSHIPQIPNFVFGLLAQKNIDAEKIPERKKRFYGRDSMKKCLTY
jgi:hypothetical protein